MNYLISFCVSFIYIYLKSFQQINVIFKKYKAVLPVSMLMALCEVSIITLVARDSFWLFIPIGLGGDIGCLLSVKINHKE